MLYFLKESYYYYINTLHYYFDKRTLNIICLLMYKRSTLKIVFITNSCVLFFSTWILLDDSSDTSYDFYEKKNSWFTFCIGQLLMNIENRESINLYLTWILY